MSTNLVPLGKILSPHGLKGQVKIWSYTEVPEDIAAYGPLSDAQGKRSFRITVQGQAGKAVIARIDGIKSREAAEALKNTELCIPRETLPPTGEDQYYHSDLLGLTVTLEDGTAYGTVAYFHDFGAGDVVEIRLATDPKETEMFAFTQANFPVIAPAQKRIVICPPETIEDRN